MKSTDFKDRAQYDFASLIEDGGGNGYRMYEIFDSFIFFAYAALRQPVIKLLTGAIDDTLEAEYLQRIKRYKEPSKFCEAMALLVNELEREPRDFLGDVYQALGMADKDFRGQCFTPKHLCDVMARMTFSECKPDPKKRLTISEPCVGGGAMAIAVVQYLRELGFGMRDFYLWGTDISAQCFHMGYVQLSLLGVPAIITHGNSLNPHDTDTHAHTLTGALFPYRREPEPIGPLITARTRSRFAVELPPITARSRTKLEFTYA